LVGFSNTPLVPCGVEVEGGQGKGGHVKSMALCMRAGGGALGWVGRRKEGEQGLIHTLTDDGVEAQEDGKRSAKPKRMVGRSMANACGHEGVE